MNTRYQAVADGLFRCIESGNAEGINDIYHDDIEVWLNTTGRALDKKGNLHVLRQFIKATDAIRYTNIERDYFDGGLVQRHTLECDLLNGDKMQVDACLVIHFLDDRIYRIYEYMDSKALEPLFA